MVSSGSRMPFHPSMLLSIISTFVPSCSVTALSPFTSGVFFTVAMEATITAWLAFRFSFCCILAKVTQRTKSKSSPKAEKKPIFRFVTSSARKYKSRNDRQSRSTTKLTTAQASMLKE